MFLPPVFQKLKASADVKNIVGSNPPRIYRHGAAPQDTSKPYITWALVGAAPENNLSSTPPIDAYIVQVDCWHQTDSGIESLAEAARNALEPYAHMTGIPINQRELSDTKLFRISLQFDWWHEREDTVPVGPTVPDYLNLSGDAAPGQLLLSGDAQTNGSLLVI